MARCKVCQHSCIDNAHKPEADVHGRCTGCNECNPRVFTGSSTPYTQEDHDAEVEHWEQHRRQLRTLFLAGQNALKEAEGDVLKSLALKLQPGRLDGIEYKRQDDILVKRITACDQRLRASRFFRAQRFKERQEEDKGFKRWHGPYSEAEALAMKHRGHEVRCTGVKKWEVKD